MGEKKKPGRFTLRFNLEDPQQRSVSELLEQQGRHKAQFITSVVLLYIQCSKPQSRGEKPPAIDEADGAYAALDPGETPTVCGGCAQ